MYKGRKRQSFSLMYVHSISTGCYSMTSGRNGKSDVHLVQRNFEIFALMRCSNICENVLGFQFFSLKISSPSISIFYEPLKSRGAWFWQQNSGICSWCTLRCEYYFCSCCSFCWGMSRLFYLPLRSILESFSVNIFQYWWETDFIDC